MAGICEQLRPQNMHHAAGDALPLMIIALLVIIALLLLVIASQTHPKGTLLIRPGFLWALGATLPVGLLLLAVSFR
jgi:hypothetical protein